MLIYWKEADILEGGSSELERRSKLVEVITKSKMKRQAFLGFVSLDCRKLASDGLDQYISLLSLGCKQVLANTPVMSLYCHVLYAFLKTKLNVTAMVLESISVAVLAKKSSSLPPDMNELLSFLTTLHDKGLVLFLRNEQELEISWIVVDKEAFLREVCGPLFAPVAFKEHVVISSNTGVVPFSMLVDFFPHHKPNIHIALLKFFHLCQNIVPNFQQEVVSNFVTIFIHHQKNVVSCSSQLYLVWIVLVQSLQNVPSKFHLCGAWHLPIHAICSHVQKRLGVAFSQSMIFTGDACLKE